MLKILDFSKKKLFCFTYFDKIMNARQKNNSAWPLWASICSLLWCYELQISLFYYFFFLTAPVLHSIHGLHSVCSFTSNLRNLKVFYLHFESALCTDFIFDLCRVSIRANAVIWMLLVTSLIEQALHIFSLHEQKAALAGNDRPKACSRHSGLQI